MRAMIHACGRARMLGAIMLLALLTPTPPALAAPKPLTKAEQERIAAAIKKGVDYLQRTQGKIGTWEHAKPRVKYAKDLIEVRLRFGLLPGLALLECGVPAADPGIQKIAELVRNNQRMLAGTFTLSLAILFLDRLGEARDESLIQSLAVRLLAGQHRDGAWGYYCPTISDRNEKAILETLRKLWPPAPVKEAAPPTRSLTGGGAPSSGKSAAALRKPARSGSSPKDPAPAGRGSPSTDVADLIPPPLRILTVFQSLRGSKVTKPRRPTYLDVADTENVATHFAHMALWTARRHGVPVDQTLRLLANYFKRSQMEDGNWPYRYRNGINPQLSAWDSRNMLGIGLLGLATGHALQPVAAKMRHEIRDPLILKSFARLDRELGRPTGDMSRTPPDPGLFFLWMVQQTAQAYGLEAIGDKDWYRWGAESLVNTQTSKGNWPSRIMVKVKIPVPGSLWNGASTTTSLALLFLKKIDLVKPLSERIRFDPKQLSK